MQGVQHASMQHTERNEGCINVLRCMRAAIYRGPQQLLLCRHFGHPPGCKHDVGHRRRQRTTAAAGSVCGAAATCRDCRARGRLPNVIQDALTPRIPVLIVLGCGHQQPCWRVWLFLTCLHTALGFIPLVIQRTKLQVSCCNAHAQSSSKTWGFFLGSVARMRRLPGWGIPVLLLQHPDQPMYTPVSEAVPGLPTNVPSIPNY